MTDWHDATVKLSELKILVWIHCVYKVLERVPNVKRLEGTDHILSHGLDEQVGVSKEELDLESLVIQIQRVSTSIIQNK